MNNLWFILISVFVAFTTTFTITLLYNKRIGRESQDDQKKLLIDKVVGVSTILAALASFVVGMVSISVMLSQNKMQQTLINLQQMEHQPSFEISTDVFEHTWRGTDYCTEYYIVTNNGERINTISVDSKEFLMIRYTHDRYGDTEEILTYMPICYYGDAVNTGRFAGEVAHSLKIWSNNIIKYEELLESIRQYNITEKISILYIEQVHFVTCKYEDIYGVNRTVYFKNQAQISQSHYEEIVNLARDEYGEHLRDIHSISIEDILNEGKNISELRNRKNETSEE